MTTSLPTTAPGSAQAGMNGAAAHGGEAAPRAATLKDRYRALPRSSKWLLWSVVVVIGYFAAIEPAMNATSQLNQRADSIERRLTDAARLRGELTRLAPENQRTLQALGSTRGPFKQVAGDAYADLDALLSRLRAAHELSSDNRTQATLDRDGRPPQQVAATLPWLTGPSGERKLDRYSVEWRFDATTDQLLATLADLEKAPEVHAVSSLEVRKADQAAIRARGIPTLLSARVTVEFWAVPRDQSSPFDSIAQVPTTTAPAPAPRAAVAPEVAEPAATSPPPEDTMTDPSAAPSAPAAAPAAPAAPTPSAAPAGRTP